MNSQFRFVLVLAAVSLFLGSVTYFITTITCTHYLTKTPDIACKSTLRFLLNSHQIQNHGIPINGSYESSSMILDTYKKNNYKPFWINEKGPAPEIEELIKTILRSERWGLNPKDYSVRDIVWYLLKIRKKHSKGSTIYRDLADLELLCTHTFHQFASHMLYGVTDPKLQFERWIPAVEKIDIPQLMTLAVKYNSIEYTLERLHPEIPDYHRLLEARTRLLEIKKAGGWPGVSEKERLRFRSLLPAVKALRQRLVITGDLDNRDYPYPDYFDRTLEEGVKKFQKRHGLKITGVVATQDFKELNKSIDFRMKQIAINLDRWRWLPHDPGAEYIWVNIADYELVLRKHNQVTQRMKVIVGKEDRQTPAMSHQISKIVFNPNWYIPRSIATRDLLPEIKKNKNFFTRHRIDIVTGENKVVDPNTVDWESVTTENFTYYFSQRRGKNNALGQVKFLFPNEFSIYLHDTHTKSLFNKHFRMFSSGCVRLEKPQVLANEILKNELGWDETRIQSVIDSENGYTVILTNPYPIHIMYITVWLDENGEINFRPDIYERDARLLEEYL